MTAALRGVRQLGDSEHRVLDLYSARMSDADVVLDVPVGHDRTLTGLLVAGYALRQGRSVAYLTDDSDRALSRASVVPGLPVVRKLHGQNSLNDIVAYYNAQALGVMDFPTYFNTNPKVEPAEVVVFDDRDTAYELVGSLFTLRVDRRLQRRAYDGFCDLVLSLGDESYATVARMRHEGADSLLSPRQLDLEDWARIVDRAAEVLTPALCTEDARFTWPRLQPWLHKCRVLIAPAGVEIRPPHQLIRALPGYRHAAQRVFLERQPVEPTVEPAKIGRDLQLPDTDRLTLSPNMLAAVAYLRGNYADSGLTLGRVARRAYMSQYHFSRRFKQETGWRFIDFVTALRLTEAKNLLRNTTMSITDVSRTVGYQELSHFQRTFKKWLGTSASGYRARDPIARAHGQCWQH
ncbi:helix-turn-helix transcriptional regulator [Streptomyces cellulosae]|uniref:Helix-turn-helix transcriptional regulator n=1 Tax=Streptomyces cellulosae TaxID=1968 RepID=A0ABW7YEC6_STRCE